MRKLFLLYGCLLPASFVAAATDGVTTKEISVRNSSELQRIVASDIESRKSYDRLTIKLAANVYVLKDTYHINQSNVSIIAEPGTKVLLADHVNKPVVAIGSQEEVPSYFVENIYISGLEIDGNKSNQDSEYDAAKPWIRNNGIDVRAARNLVMENIRLKDNRSGGLVISWGSSDVYVRNSEFDDNFFDGVAYYDSTRVFTSNVSMKNNGGAGISLDNDFRDSIFSDCIIDSNEDVGIFMRFSTEVRFDNCTVKNSGSYAVFMGHDGANNGVHDTVFFNAHFLNNHGGVFLGSMFDTQSSGVGVVGSVFRNNGSKNIQSSGAMVWESGNVEVE